MKRAQAVVLGILAALALPIVAPLALGMAAIDRVNRWLDEDEAQGSSCGGWPADLMGDMKGGCER